jgi:hypothetical protein
MFHFEPEIILQNASIMKVINGDFSQHDGEKYNRKESFYRDVVTFLPDAIVLTDIMHNVKYVDKSFERIF